jgi:hypothetical protein
MKGWNASHKSSPIFSNMIVTYSYSSSGCVAQFMLTFSNIFGKLLGNIQNVCSHKALGMATTMDVLRFQSHQKLPNTRKIILKLTSKDVTLDEICKHFGPQSSKNG